MTTGMTTGMITGMTTGTMVIGLVIGPPFRFVPKILFPQGSAGSSTSSTFCGVGWTYAVDGSPLT